MIQLTLTVKMTTAKVVETSVTVNNNSPIQDYVHPDDQTQPTFEMTPGFKPFIDLIIANKSQSRHSHNSQNLELFRNIIVGIGAIFRASKSFPVRAQFL